MDLGAVQTIDSDALGFCLLRGGAERPWRDNMDDLGLIAYQRRRAACADEDALILCRAADTIAEMDNINPDDQATISSLRMMAQNRRNSRHLMEATADRLEDLVERVAIMEEGRVTSDMANKITEAMDALYGLMYLVKVLYRSSGKASAELDELTRKLSKQVDDIAMNLACMITDPEYASLMCACRRLMAQDECGGNDSHAANVPFSKTRDKDGNGQDNI